MTEVEFISDLKSRFNITRVDIKRGLKHYEYEMFYEMYPKLSRIFINRSIYRFLNGKIKASKAQNRHREAKEESRGRGYFQAGCFGAGRSYGS